MNLRCDIALVVEDDGEICPVIMMVVKLVVKLLIVVLVWFR